MEGSVPNLQELTAEDYQALIQELQALRLQAAAQTANIGAPPTPQIQAQVPTPGVAIKAMPKPPKPDPFRGNRKVASWLFTLEQFYLASGVIDEEQKVIYAATLLRDAAADWWRGLNMAAAAIPFLR